MIKSLKNNIISKLFLMKFKAKIGPSYLQNLNGVISKWIRDRSDFNYDEQIAFIERLESYRKNDTIKLPSILLKLKKIYSEHYGKDCIQVKVAQDLYKSVERGEQIFQPMRKWFRSDIYQIYSCSEYSGKSSQAVEQITNMLKEEKLAKSSFISSLKYPFIVLFFGNLVLFGSLMLMVPFVNNLAGGKVDLIEDFTLFLKISDVIGTYYMAPIVLILSIVIFTVYKLKSTVGLERHKMTKAPIVSSFFILDRDFKNARYLSLLSLMNSSDLKLVKCVKFLIRDASPDMQFHLKRIEKGIALGDNKKNFFATNMLSTEAEVALELIFDQGADGFHEALNFLASGIYEHTKLSLSRLAKRIKTSMYIVGTIIFGLGAFVLVTCISQLIVYSLSLQ